MTDNTESRNTAKALRRKAEEKVASQPSPNGENDAMRLLHELQVHQIELEMQNQELQNSSAELEKQQEYFADFYDFSPIGFVNIDQNGGINHINSTGAKLLGRKRPQLTGANFASFVTMADLPVFNNFLQQLF